MKRFKDLPIGSVVICQNRPYIKRNFLGLTGMLCNAELQDGNVEGVPQWIHVPLNVEIPPGLPVIQSPEPPKIQVQKWQPWAEIEEDDGQWQVQYEVVEGKLNCKMLVAKDKEAAIMEVVSLGIQQEQIKVAS